MDCKEAIYSNEYYDLIVDNTDARWEAYLPSCTQRINHRYTIGYWNREVLSPVNLTEFTYSAIPKVYTILDQEALEASGILQTQNQPTLSLKGQGVFVGIIDTGIDLTLPVFQNPDGTSRIRALWDQTLEEGPPPEGFSYGTFYRQEDITPSLPTRDTNGHGTYVSALAAGNDGAAPYSELLVVKLKEAKPYLRDFYFVPEGVPCYQENDIMAGVAFLNQIAGELGKPLSLCIALGTTFGAHDSSGPLNHLLTDQYTKRGRSAVVASGNEANERHHYRGAMGAQVPSPSPASTAYETVEINVTEGVKGFCMELWYPLVDERTVEVVSPTGELLPKLSRQTVRRAYTFVFEGTRVTVEKNITFPESSLQLIFFRFENPGPGLWNIRVYPEQILQGDFGLWLPMASFLSGEVDFLKSDPNTTITNPGNNRNLITTGGYDTRKNVLYLNSGRGYNSLGEIKPDLVAPAVDVVGPGIGGIPMARSGTSAGATITAGAVALLMEWAIVDRNYPGMLSSDMKNILIRGAGRNPMRTYPNPEWGYGTLNLYEAFNRLRTV